MGFRLFDSLPMMMRGGLVIMLSRSWFELWTVVVPVFRPMMRRVVNFSAVATAFGLLVLRIDMTASSADAAIENGAAFSFGTVGPLMVVGHRRSGTQVESPASTAREFTHGVDVSTSHADPAVHSVAVIATQVTASAEHERSRG